MNKNERQVELLRSLIEEKKEIEKIINALPRGYISSKTISGHVYNYRQWREGKKIFSEYVPDAFLPAVKRKIASRKEQEESLKAVKKEIKSASKFVIKHGLMTEEEINSL